MTDEQTLENKKMWDDYMKSMNEYADECDRINNRILNVIKGQLGVKFEKALLALAEESEVDGVFELVRKTSGSYQKENYGSFRGYWVEQRSVGDSGDSWDGYIYVKLKPKLFIKMHYSM